MNDRNQDQTSEQDAGNDSREEPPRRPRTPPLPRTYHVMSDGTVYRNRAEALADKQGR